MPTPKKVKHTQIICRLLLTNCLSVFDHFMGLALKGLKLFAGKAISNTLKTDVSKVSFITVGLLERVQAECM